MRIKYVLLFVDSNCQMGLRFFTLQLNIAQLSNEWLEHGTLIGGWDPADWLEHRGMNYKDTVP